jgi:hypothetical protein
VRDARASRETDGAVHRIQVIDTIARHGRQVERIEDAQRQQVLEPFAGWRQRMHCEVAVRRGQRIEPDRCCGFQIAQRQAAIQ